MANNEFEIIKKYFASQSVSRRDVDIGIGDDCAVMTVPEGCQLVVTTDTLVAGVHFLSDADPVKVGHKALASNLSDLAAMGALPAWCSLALTMPSNDEAWLSGFCEGFSALAEYYNVELVGGDTTRGPLAITITMHGYLPKGTALTRGGAAVGDWIYVTGELGDAAAGLAYILGKDVEDNARAAHLIERHFMSLPRIATGQALRNVASSAIDISDGLIADLGHILTASEVSAVINVDDLPISEALIAETGTEQDAQKLALTSGEEYELCFTVPEANRGMLDTALAHSATTFTCIGQIRAGSGAELMSQGKVLDWDLSGWDHFRGEQ